MGDTSKYLAYAVNIGIKKDKSRRSYVSFGNVFFEIEFIEACSRKLGISLSRFDILSITIKDMEKSCCL